MTVVCHVVNFPEKRDESARINGGPCLSALVDVQRVGISSTDVDWICCTLISRRTRKKLLQILGSCGSGLKVSLRRGLNID